MKLIAAVSDEKDLDRIPDLLDRAGIQAEHVIFATGDRVHRCRRDKAEVTVVAMVKKAPCEEFLSRRETGPLRDRINADILKGNESDFCPVFIEVKEGS